MYIFKKNNEQWHTELEDVGSANEMRQLKQWQEREIRMALR